MATELSPDAVAFMDSKLRLVATKYSLADVEAVQSEIPAIAAETGWNLGYGIGCTVTGEWGLEVTRYAVQATPEVVAETEARFAQFGDKIALRYCDCVIATAALPAPAPAPATVVAPPPSTDRLAAPRVGAYVTRPTTGRCVRGGVLTVKTKAGAKSVRLSAGKRHASGKTARLRLKQRSTRVTFTVTLKDGRTTSQRLTFRRC